MVEPLIDIMPVTQPTSLSVESTAKCVVKSGHISGGGPLDFMDTVSINAAYFSGVAVMRGSPRQHIWTFAAEVSENDTIDTTMVTVHVTPQ